MQRLFLSILCGVLLAIAPLSSFAQDNEKPVKIVASFSILGDMIRQVGGTDVVVDTLVGPNEDAHEFQPSPDDARRLAQADIIAINGLHFEGWIGRLIKASGTNAKLLVASAGVQPRILEDAPHAEGETPVDPHAWQDLRNGKLYIKNITTALIAARPEKEAVFKHRAKAIIDGIDALDQSTREAFAQIPAEKRTVITTHDAFGYFGAAYDIHFIAPIGINTEAQPSAANLAKLEKQITTNHIQAVFIENMTDPRLIEQIANDTGIHVGGKLYADALSPADGEAPTYLAMMRVNIRRILADLQ